MNVSVKVILLLILFSGCKKKCESFTFEIISSEDSGLMLVPDMSCEYNDQQWSDEVEKLILKYKPIGVSIYDSKRYFAFYQDGTYNREDSNSWGAKKYALFIIQWNGDTFSIKDVETLSGYEFNTLRKKYSQK